MLETVVPPTEQPPVELGLLYLWFYDMVQPYTSGRELQVKTTIDINDELLLEAKRRAAAAGMTLKALIEEALQARMLERHREIGNFRLELPIVHGTAPPAVDIADRRNLYDVMENT